MRDVPRPRAKLWARVCVASLVVVTALLLVLAPTWISVRPDARDPVHDAASAAIVELNDGNLAAVARMLAIHRGDPDFAYFFASQATPRALGDALGKVGNVNSGSGAPTAFPDSDDYELAITDLAGVLGLATFGIGNRALDIDWIPQFVEAMSVSWTQGPITQRVAQDVANRQNLLLLLSRGYWSSDFLQAVTREFWRLDAYGAGDAWPTPRFPAANYAPSPTGIHLSDGLVALLAALAANPDASLWAFTEFQPGTELVNYDCEFHPIGKFAHHLLLGHEFVELEVGGSGRAVGTSAAMAALSAAMVAEASANGTEELAESAETGRDAEVLKGLAQASSQDGVCSIQSRIGDFLGDVSSFVQRWGHTALAVASLLTFVPGGQALGLAAAGTNAAWYAAEGDFAAAGLALAAAVPGLAVAKAAKSLQAGGAAAARARGTADVAEAAQKIRAGLRVPGRTVAASTAKPLQAIYRLEREAQEELASKYPGSVMEKWLDPKCRTSCFGTRRVDVYDSRTRTCFEVKRGIGRSNARHDFQEVNKDLRLRRTGKCRVLQWHFFPDENGQVGPYAELDDRLARARIAVVRYVD